MTEPAWIAAAEAELARLSAAAGAVPEDWVKRDLWFRKRDAQRHEFNAALAPLLAPSGGGVHKLDNGQGWVFRAFRRRATSTSSWEGAVRNAIAAERKKVAV